MAEQWYEHELYRQFLSSQERASYLPSSVYGKLVKSIPTNEGTCILDFGTGLGYVALSLAKLYKNKSHLHIFACDHQEQLLDHCWYTLTKKKITNVTPFFIPNRASISFPPWLPKMKQIICSLVLSSSENPEKIIQTIHKIAEPNAVLHIVEWNKKKLPKELENIIPQKNLIDPEQLEVYLTKSNYAIMKSYFTDNYFFAISARIPDEGVRLTNSVA